MRKISRWILVSTLAACKRTNTTIGTTAASRAREWTENLGDLEELSVPTVMGTDASGQMQVYGVVTDNEGKAVTGAGGKQVTKKYTTTKAGQKNTTTAKKRRQPKSHHYQAKWWREQQ